MDGFDLTPKINSLATKMILVMDEVKYIQKKGLNSFHKYKYATEADVVAAFSGAMKKHQIFMFHSMLEREDKPYKTRGGKDAFLVTVKIQVTFVDCESGERFVGDFYGDGSDSDDKGVYKAITGALKYALMKTFLVSTGDDPEREEVERERNVRNETEKKYLLESLEEAAQGGVVGLKEKWEKLDGHQKNLVKDDKDKFKAIAIANDKEKNAEFAGGSVDAGLAV